MEEVEREEEVTVLGVRVVVVRAAGEKEVGAKGVEVMVGVEVGAKGWEGVGVAKLEAAADHE